jgi:hypothetical protein
MKRYFDEASITENRMATLSDSQKKRLWWEIAKRLSLNTIALCFILAIAGGILPPAFFISLVFGVYLYTTAKVVIKNIKDIYSSSLKMITGQTEKYILWGRNPKKFFIKIQNNPPIDISVSLYKELLNKSKYTFFITENGNKVVNFESLTPNIEVLDYPVDNKYLLYRIINYAILCFFLLLIASAIYFNGLAHNSR